MSFSGIRTVLTVAVTVCLVVAFVRLGYSKHVVAAVFAVYGALSFATAALLSRRRIQPSGGGYSVAGSALMGLGSLSTAATAMFAESQATVVRWGFVAGTLLLVALGLLLERSARARHRPA